MRERIGNIPTKDPRDERAKHVRIEEVVRVRPLQRSDIFDSDKDDQFGSCTLVSTNSHTRKAVADRRRSAAAVAY